MGSNVIYGSFSAAGIADLIADSYDAAVLACNSLWKHSFIGRNDS